MGKTRFAATRGDTAKDSRRTARREAENARGAPAEEASDRVPKKALRQPEP